jgi:hypothetical protein
MDPVRDWFKPPMPVTFAVHGVRADPVHGTLGGQVTTVIELAWSMVNVSVSLLPVWLASPA